MIAKDGKRLRNQYEPFHVAVCQYMIRKGILHAEIARRFCQHCLDAIVVELPTGMARNGPEVWGSVKGWVALQASKWADQVSLAAEEFKVTRGEEIARLTGKEIPEAMLEETSDESMGEAHLENVKW
ncbi:hypothetical protein MMC25_005325 [Agyrium rufum]|nr:hypothetical protein [Agyrium rufum]